eukprot:CAMPEP_0204230500 /NCGR_PEP_ID=MMETSP0361-20130328/88009_1 /ASSEMBLY_ACC=CAM_ASM_000343 /TAXON_ID=268821 /ORGANISM="Scrippsiella Hangoei, Strain SHTV-5" /LENGTH=39 /DNA_ID= /DNA_START= /DNA_END= /DNA_ORIENTATION=
MQAGNQFVLNPSSRTSCPCSNGTQAIKAADKHHALKLML